MNHDPAAAPPLGSSSDATSPIRLARIAGLCSLFVIAGGVFAALFVRGRLIVAGDPVATASAIAAHEGLWRWGIAIHLVYLFAGAAFGVILYRLFRPYHPVLALLAFVLMMCDVALEALLLSALTVPLQLERAAYAAWDPAQRQALGYLAVRLFLTGWSFALLLFSGFCAVTGVMILRSRLLPRLVGALMIGAGASYFTTSLAGVVAPGFRGEPLLVLSFLGEASLALWLVAKGVRAPASSGPR